MGARLPDRADLVERDGVKIAFEVHGEGNEPTLVLEPTPLHASDALAVAICHALAPPLLRIAG